MNLESESETETQKKKGQFVSVRQYEPLKHLSFDTSSLSHGVRAKLSQAIKSGYLYLSLNNGQFVLKQLTAGLFYRRKVLLDK